MNFIDTTRYCKDQARLMGEASPLELTRLAAEVMPGSDFTVAWIAKGVAPDQLELQLQAQLQLRCQRCLLAMAEDIGVTYRFKFVKDEATALAEDEQNDEIDCLVHDKQFDLQALIEDEMLMALPLAALHPVCPTAGALDFKPAASKPNPFELLGSLKLGSQLGSSYKS